MTDYGRGPGSEPWHPEEPQYGGPGWGAQASVDGAAPHGGQPQQVYAQQAQPQTYYETGHDPYQQVHQTQPQPQYTGQQVGDGFGGGQFHGGQHHYAPAPEQPYHAPSYGAQGQQPPQRYSGAQHDDPQYGGTPYNDPQYNDPQYNDPQYNDPQYNGGWDTGQQAAMPYGGQPAPPYDVRQAGGPEQRPDDYVTPDAYPPPRPPAHRDPEPGPDAGTADDDARDTKETAGDDGAGETAGGAARRDRRGKGGKTGKGKKSRNGVACLFVTVVLVGGVGGVGYVGFQFWADRYGPPPDFAGKGSGTVQVEIPQGSAGYEIAAILVKNGVVKSQRAFVAAQQANPKGNTIQAGVYTLAKEMSAASAVERMLSPSSHNSLIIPEGTRNAKVYAQIDKQLDLPDGTTEKAAKEHYGQLGLPKWAKSGSPVKDPLEGFLYPASYPVAKGTKPEDVLKKMVARSNAEYNKLDLEGNAKKYDLDSPWDLLTVASLVQVEGKTQDDFRKMAEVVYNRLKPTNTETNQLLQFDSAFNYLKGQSEIEISESEINSNQDPYNTYTQKGLTPGPISNPGPEALAAALDPTDDGWLYFVATDGKHKTEFAKTHDEFQELKNKFNSRGSGG
ncbi:endolytic transglycosylase MltG [Streptomyces sp. NPDC004749]